MSSADWSFLAQSIFASLNPEIWIITAASTNGRGGLVATWVKESSLDPATPTLMAGIAPNHHTADLISASGAFAAHLIRADQVELVWKFGIGSGREHDKLDGLATASNKTGSPILADCAAWLDCSIYETKPAGDRIYYWADVVGAGRVSDEPPLRVQEMLRQADPEHLAQLKADKLADIDIQRPLRKSYRERLG